MRRRQFLKVAGSGITLAPSLQKVLATTEGITPTDGVVGKGMDVDIGALFEANSEEVLALAESVFRKCILDKLRPPVEPLQHTWVQPGGPYYMGQWIWDTMFVVDLLSLLPGQQQVIRDIFQYYWDFQDHWNKKMPDYARDMITVAIKTAPQEERQFSQIPILAWGGAHQSKANPSARPTLPPGGPAGRRPCPDPVGTSRSWRLNGSIPMDLI